MVRFIVLLCCVTLAACRSSKSPESSPGTGAISGTEKLAWDQAASSRAVLASYRYLLYVDEKPTELTNVSCSRESAPFACSASLPPMTPGRHVLMLSTFVDAGIRVESPRSAPL